MPRSNLCVIGGGARSGKSRLAQRLAIQRGRRRAYVATAEALDDEMRARVRLHRAERGADFDTIEAPLDLPAALKELGAYDVVLVDCLTVYLSNLLLYFEEEESAQGPSSGARPSLRPTPHGDAEFDGHSARLATAAERTLEQVERLAEAVEQFGPALLLVTNEVGMGVVPENELGRVFRDIAGRANQRFAGLAQELYWVMFGQALRLKPGSVIARLGLAEEGEA